ncbi:MAG: hypothetical protein CME69_06530 [Halobacteriovorax sp.]|nr:hypothetical protein [Halobacteriovorax sp.]|tara:strand:+ start:61 stop:810 length:750 start_codon:yes stop_codon:yes gene_type:complete
MKILLSLLIGLTSTYAMDKTICGPSDDRVPSSVKEIGRLLDSRTGTGGCTLTMISDNCGISAGHCRSVLYIAEFNTPESMNGSIQHSKPEDVYEIDQSTIEYRNGGPGDDWAVFKVKANDITGKSAGAAQGYYNVSFDEPTIGTPLSITGYGLDRNEPTKNLAQQTHDGALASIGDGGWYGRSESVLGHTVDTMGGNSGSTIINMETGSIVGIHTHGGCSARGGNNQGTLIAKHSNLMRAIRSCLDSDK